jgi:hypothetical protein
MAHRLARLVYRMLRYGQSMSKRVWSITNKNSDSNASNGSKKKMSSVIFLGLIKELAADGAVGRSEVAWFPGLVQRAEGSK